MRVGVRREVIPPIARGPESIPVRGVWLADLPHFRVFMRMVDAGGE